MVPKGFQFGAVEAAVKKPGRLDMGLVWCEREAASAAVFTRNTVVAAPVELSRERLGRGSARAVLVNAGNANACTGVQGRRDAEFLTEAMAGVLGVETDAVLVCSTGVIGLPLPVERMEAALGPLRDALCGDFGPFSRSILTTDLVPKAASRTVEAGDALIRITGVAKGSGMIRPDMATMLGFIVTDAKVSSATLQRLLSAANERTFNRITVDGDTSTNDTVIALASGMAGEGDVASLDEDEMLCVLFGEALEQVCRELARMIVRDGEGATKLVDVTVSGATNEQAAFRAARTIAESPLVKTALHGEDPNWGRIAGALGRSGAFSGGPFTICINGVEIVRDGLGLGSEAEAAAHQKMKGAEFEIRVELQEGDGEATVTTCDFSDGYVRINADYRS